MDRFLITVLASLLPAVATPAWAQSTSTSANLSIAITGPISTSSCPDDDGSGGLAGHSKFPSLLSGYSVTVRSLGCQVAGVDYHVGVSSTQTLSDPTTASLPTGCSYGSGTVSCDSGFNGGTLSGYDFSLHGTKLSVSANNATITENKFGGITGNPCSDPNVRI